MISFTYHNCGPCGQPLPSNFIFKTRTDSIFMLQLKDPTSKYNELYLPFVITYAGEYILASPLLDPYPHHLPPKFDKVCAWVKKTNKHVENETTGEPYCYLLYKQQGTCTISLCRKAVTQTE
jgi:hypothetical protein